MSLVLPSLHSQCERCHFDSRHFHRTQKSAVAGRRNQFDFPKLRFSIEEVEMQMIRKHRRFRAMSSASMRKLAATQFLTLGFARTTWNLTASVVLSS